MKEVDELYECRYCGGLCASNGLSCPYCDATKGDVGHRKVRTEDGTKEIPNDWYQIVKIPGGRW